MARKILFGLMAALLLASFPVSAEGESNLSAKASTTEANVGDTFTVTLSNKEMDVISFAGGIRYDTQLLTCEKIEGGREGEEGCWLLTGEKWREALALSTVEDAAKAGTVGFAFANVEQAHYEAGVLYTATFRVKASGTAEIAVYETADGDGAFTSNSSSTVSVSLGNGGTSDVSSEATSRAVTENETATQPSKTVFWIVGAALIVIAAAVIIVFAVKKK